MVSFRVPDPCNPIAEVNGSRRLIYVNEKDGHCD